MRKLIDYEFWKLTSQKIFFLFFVLLLVLNGIFINREILPRKIQNEKDMTSFIEEYKKDPDAMETYMAEYLTVYDAASKNITQDGMLSRPASIYSESDRQLFSSFASIRDLNDTYAEILQKAKKTSSGMLKEYDYLGYAENSFEVVYQKSVLDSYEPLGALRFPLENIIGFDLFFDYNGFCMFLLLAVALLGIQLITEEQSAGMLMILRVSKRGRHETVLAKLAVGLLATIVLCMLFTGVSLLVLSLRIGLHGWNLPIQMIETMQLCPLEITVGEGVLLSLLVQILTSFAFLSLVMLLSVLLKHPLAIFASVIAVIGVNFAVANYNFFDGYSFFKNINLFWCLDGTRILSVFRGVRLFDRCFSLIPTWLVLYLLLAIFAGTASIFCFANGKTVSRLRLKGKFRITIKRRPRTHYPMGLYGFELKKICSVLSAIVLLASILLTLYVSNDAYHLQRNFEMNFYTEYMKRIEGEWTEEKHAKIEAEYRENAAILAQKELMREGYLSGTVTKEEYNLYLGACLDAEVKSDVLLRIYERSEYLKTKHEEGFSASYFDDTGWNLLKKTNLAWGMCLAVIVICADVFSMEYRSGFRKIQSVTKKGRIPVGFSKFAVVITVAVVLGALSEGIQFLFVNLFSGLDGATCSVISMEIESSLSVGGYFALMALKNTLLFVILGIVTAAVSRFTKRLLPTLAVMTTAVFAPMIFFYFGITLLDKLSFLNLFVR